MFSARTSAGSRLVSMNPETRVRWNQQCFTQRHALGNLRRHTTETPASPNQMSQMMPSLNQEPPSGFPARIRKWDAKIRVDPAPP